MNRQTFIHVAAAAPLVLAGQHAALAQSTGPAVRVGDAMGDPYLQGFCAVDGGFFQKGGLNVDFQTFTSGTPIMQGVVTGNLDIGIATPVAVATAVTHGVPLVIIAPGGVNNAKVPSGYLIVAKSSTIQSAKDLEGKPIALASLRTLHELTLLTWFQNSGADPATAKIIELTFGEMGPAIERGTIAAAMQVEPLASGLVKANAVRIVDGPNRAIPEFLGATWFTTADYARKNPAVVRRFAAVIAEVSRWANAHQRESGDILARVGKMDPEAVRGMARCQFADVLRLSQIQPVLDAATKVGFLSRHVDAAELVVRS
jgi:NitT/TauT family transport system substrate-binding protein